MAGNKDKSPKVKEEYRAFSRWLNRVIADNGLRQEPLAEACGITQGQVSLMVGCQSRPDPETMLRLQAGLYKLCRLKITLDEAYRLFYPDYALPWGREDAVVVVSEEGRDRVAELIQGEMTRQKVGFVSLARNAGLDSVRLSEVLDPADDSPPVSPAELERIYRALGGISHKRKRVSMPDLLGIVYVPVEGADSCA